MIPALFALLFGVGCIWVCIVEHGNAKRAIALGRLHPDYNLWPVFAVIAGLLFSVITVMILFTHNP
jgi:uncharacterized membrane protein YidH (DUF202 family)